MADLENAFKKVCETFNLNDLNAYQREALVHFVEKDRDVFVNLPTGAGKSMIYLALPLIFDYISGTTGHIVIVVSPLVNLMKDQVSSLRSIGISSVSLSDMKEENKLDLEEGKFAVVYGTPEALLKNERWRKLLSSPPYSSKLCAIAVDEAHVIKQWGTSNNTNMAVFRESYSRLHELRALAPSVKIMALTATSTKQTKDVIMDVLLMKNPYIVYESPNKPNIAYSVCYMPQDVTLDNYFKWLSDELKEFGKSTTRTIIYCQTIKQCALIYTTLKGMLGPKLFTEELGNRKCVLMEMLHSCTPEGNKETILKAFQDKDSDIRVLVATIAFGMGIDCKGVYRSINFGPSKNVESYIQESGRAGRDGGQSVSFVLYQGLQLNHVDKDIKQYVDTSGCRRRHLLKHFDLSTDIQTPKLQHLCCDNCTKECKCGASECGDLTKFPGTTEQETSIAPDKTREVSDEQRDVVLSSLVSYHKALLKELLQKGTHTNLTISNIKFLLGFSQLQIDQVVKHCDKFFCIDDILHYAEIWDVKHAHRIMKIISETFADECEVECDEQEAGDDSDDDIDFGDWNMLLNDDDLFDLAIENLSTSLLNSSMNDTLNNSADDNGISNVALFALEHLTI